MIVQYDNMSNNCLPKVNGAQNFIETMYQRLWTAYFRNSHRPTITSSFSHVPLLISTVRFRLASSREMVVQYLMRRKHASSYLQGFRENILHLNDPERSRQPRARSVRRM